MLLSMACYFDLADDERCDRMVAWLLGEQTADGGWNCDRERAKHPSFHTTISTLEGLAAFSRARGNRAALQRVVSRGHDYFLRHRLYRSERTGEIVRPTFAKLSFPPQLVL